MRLENKVAIVTGGGSGIGRAIAETYAREGAKVVIADVNDERMQETAEAIRSAGGTVEYLHTDVSKQEDNDAMLALAIEKFGGLDIMVCNAGIMDGFDLVGHVTDDVWKRVFAINVDGPMMQMRNAVNHFLENGGGNIVVTCSAASLGGGRAGVAYTASKHALLGLMRNTAFCYSRQGIRCNAMAPGGVQTNIQESMKKLDPEGAKLIQAGMGIMPRVGEPQELANVALFLASEEASYVNGVVLPVDAGWEAY